MEAHCSFSLQLFLISCLLIGIHTEGELNKNVTVPKMPTTQAISEEHTLAEPPKLIAPKQSDPSTTIKTPKVVVENFNHTSSTAGVAQVDPSKKTTVSGIPERKVVGREGVVYEHQPKEKPVEVATNTTSIPLQIVTVTAAAVANKAMQNASNANALRNNTSVETSSKLLNVTTSAGNLTNYPTSSTHSTSSSTTSTTTTTTTIATTTSTTSKPKKPTITFSIEDDPSIINVTRGKIHDRNSNNGRLTVEMPDPPIAQPSKDAVVPPIHRDYFISVVGVIFAVPIVMGAVIVIVRRFKDYWSTRHYRRMDFLVDGMYND